MVKPAITALLALFCLLLIMANINTFLADSPGKQKEIETAKKSVSRKTVPMQPLNLNPTPTPKPPDLGNGYLFNAERFLAKGTRPNKTGKGLGKNIRMEDVVFNGALLGEGYNKALVSYNLSTRPTTRAVRPGLKTKPSRGKETVMLAVGDQLGGYTVKEISADFILFVKGSDTIKKMLFDPDKKRPQVTSRPSSSSKSLKKAPAVVPARRRVAPKSANKPYKKKP